MTIEELIERLREFDPQQKLLIFDNDSTNEYAIIDIDEDEGSGVVYLTVEMAED